MLKIICLSDTHGYHRKIEIPVDADMIIHAGDLTMSGEASQVEDFLEYWIEERDVFGGKIK